jgi:hypothetical protein
MNNIYENCEKRNIENIQNTIKNYENLGYRYEEDYLMCLKKKNNLSITTTTTTPNDENEINCDIFKELLDRQKYLSKAYSIYYDSVKKGCKALEFIKN